MFERIEVWERTAECVWVYVVFRDLQSHLFHVQQGSAVYETSIHETRDGIARRAITEVELFLETPPPERSRGYATLGEAVANHKAAFAEMMTGPAPQLH